MTSSQYWNQPQWDREQPRCFWDPSRKLLKSIRDYQTLLVRKKSVINMLRQKICVLRHVFWSVITTTDIPLNCQIGGGLMLPHPNGIVVHPDAVIGANCLIFQQVTITSNVTLGCHVDIGAGAKLLGPLVIEDNVRIGANAVVTKDVAQGQTVVGIPAKPIDQ